MRWMVVLVAVALAGCGDAGSPPAQDAPLEVDELETSDALGAISGVVVDPFVRPVAGATVRLVQTDGSGTTGEDDRFAFQGLEAGLYAVEVHADRFRTTQASADEPAGRPTTVKVQVTPDLEPEAFHETLGSHGLIVVGDIYGTWTLQDVVAGDA